MKSDHHVKKLRADIENKVDEDKKALIVKDLANTYENGK